MPKKNRMGRARQKGERIDLVARHEKAGLVRATVTLG
jgi:hypothetical protein